MSDELRARVETLDAVPEPLRPFYKQSDKGFVLHLPDAEDVYAAGLKKNRDELLAQQARDKEARKAFDGIDPEKARTALAAQAKAEEEKAKAEGNFEQLKASLLKAHGEEKQTLTAQLAEQEADLFDAIATRELYAAFDKHDGIADALTPHLKQHIKVMRENGKRVARVVDAQGNVRFYGPQGEPMTIDALIDEDKKSGKHPWGYRGTGSSGGGAPSGGRAPTTSPTVVGRDAFLANIDAIANGTVTVK